MDWFNQILFNYLPAVPSESGSEGIDPLLTAYIAANPLQPVSTQLLETAEKRLMLPSKDISHLACTLGRFVRDLPRGIVTCPVYVFEEQGWVISFRHDLSFVDSMEVASKPGTKAVYSPERPHGFAGFNSENVIVGYDTEYVTVEREVGPNEDRGIITTDLRMVSHQVYFSLGLEHICVVLVTARRFTQKAFLREFLANAIPDSMVIYRPATHAGKDRTGGAA
jgi:hypothetical protein